MDPHRFERALKTRVTTTAAAGIAALLLVSACGSDAGSAGGESRPVSMMLGYSYTGVYAPLFEGVSQGFFADRGIDLTIDESTGSSASSIALETGKIDFAMLNSPSAFELVDQGAEIIDVAQVGQTGGIAFISLTETGIEVPADLEGKTIGVEAGESLAGSLMPQFFELNGVDASTIEIVDMDAAVMTGALTEGHIDALAGYSQSSGLRLKHAGEDTNEISWDEYGLPLVTYGLFARTAMLSDDPDLVRDMVAAVVESYTYARDNQQQAIETCYALFPQVDKELATLQLAWLMTPDSLGDETREDNPLGWIPADRLSKTLELSGNASTDPATYYTDEFLPESGS